MRAGGEVLTNLEVEGACVDYCYLNLVAPSNVVGEGEEQKLPESEVLAEGAFLGLPSLEGQVVPAWVEVVFVAGAGVAEEEVAGREASSFAVSSCALLCSFPL